MMAPLELAAVRFTRSALCRAHMASVIQSTPALASICATCQTFGMALRCSGLRLCHSDTRPGLSLVEVKMAATASTPPPWRSSGEWRVSRLSGLLPDKRREIPSVAGECPWGVTPRMKRIGELAAELLARLAKAQRRSAKAMPQAIIPTAKSERTTRMVVRSDGSRGLGDSSRAEAVRWAGAVVHPTLRHVAMQARAQSVSSMTTPSAMTARPERAAVMRPPRKGCCAARGSRWPSPARPSVP